MKPSNFPKINALSEIEQHSIDKNFHFVSSLKG
jgi:hypothetical protein